MKSQIKHFKYNAAANAGFTLIELLVAAVIMSIVVTMAGTAFVAMIQQNQKAELETARRTNLNRALDYIANDIRTANKIEGGSATGEVIKLTIPSADPTKSTAFNTSASTVTYATRTKTSTEVWDGPQLITNNTTSVLVDGLKAPNTAPTCPTGSTLRGDNGFYACVYTGGKKVDLYLYGKLSDQTTQTMEVKSTAYTRSSTTGI